MLSKKEFRQSLRGIEAAPPEYSLSMTELIMDSELFKNAGTILAFYGVGSEPNTVPLMDHILASGRRLCLPLTYPGGIMDARLVTSMAQLSTGRYNIPEPSAQLPLIAPGDIDLILVPGLSFDLKGYRMGHGAGYYDRYLSGYKGQTLGLCFENRLRSSIPRDEYDLPVNHIVTEGRLIHCFK